VANLDEAVGKVLAMQATFTEFARTVLATTYNAQEEAKLRAEVDLRYAHHHAITDKGLPKNKPWGAGHLDAVGMILNGVAGLDIGPRPTHMILENMHRADAPVRPSSLWNAPRQNHTQWPGFANNGDRLRWPAMAVRSMVSSASSFRRRTTVICCAPITRRPIRSISRGSSSNLIVSSSASARRIGPDPST
jgi:hypothetical protein